MDNKKPILESKKMGVESNKSNLSAKRNPVHETLFNCVSCKYDFRNINQYGLCVGCECRVQQADRESGYYAY